MKSAKCVLGSVFLTFLVVATAIGEEYLQHLLALPDNTQRVAYVQSLDRNAAITLASQAIESGWNAYGVGIGILAPMWEKKPPTCEELVGILTNRDLHPRLRAEVGMSGLGFTKQWDTGAVLQYADGLLMFLEDASVSYVHKQGLPGRLCRYTSDRMKALPKDGSNNSALDDLLGQNARAITYLARLVVDAANRSDDPDHSLSSACADLIECLGWCAKNPIPHEDTNRGTLDAVRKGREALTQVLTDTGYSGDVARLVLRRSEQAGLAGTLTKGAITKIKDDPRFSNEEDQRLLDALSREVKSGG